MTAALGPAWTVRAPALPARPEAALAAVDAAMAPGDLVLAHSMGAVVALRALARRPRPVAGLVLTGAFFPPARNGRTTAASVRDYLGHRVALGRELARGRGDGAERTAGSPRALALLLRQAAGRDRAEPTPDVPVLVVHARDDHHVPVDFAIAATARHPRWTLRLLDSGGHHAHVTRPEAWVDAVRPWLDGLSPAG